jgi:hypothetical protein
MKFLILTLTLLASTFALANVLTWGDLDFETKYTLTSDIVFNEQQTLHKGDAFVVNDKGAGPGFVYISFKNLMCTDPTLKSELILFNPEPEDTVNDKSVGVEMFENCEVSVYVETKFYYSKSMFE